MDTDTDWTDGSVSTHYIGWYDPQMRSRLNDENAPRVLRASGSPLLDTPTLAHTYRSSISSIIYKPFRISTLQ